MSSNRESSGMPQPLLSVAPGADPSFSASAIYQRPNLAPSICTIFSAWAIIEHQQDMLLVQITDGSSAAAISMFRSLRSDRAKQDALTAAAKVSLTQTQFSAFEVVMSVIRSSQKARNRFAHHVWGYCSELPDDILLTDPINAGNLMTHVTQMLHARKRNLPITFDPKSVGLDKARVIVYSKKDIDVIIQRLTEVSQVVLYFSALLSADNTERLAPKRDHHKSPGTVSFALRTLTGLRLFRQARHRIRDSRRNTQQTPNG